MTEKECAPYYSWTQINADKVAELSELAHNSPRSFVVLMALRANAGGENACVCSARVLADCLNVSTRRIYSCISYLRDGGWIITLRSGYGTIFVLNGDITWHSWGSGKYYCQLKANVVITLDEQAEEMKTAVMQQAFKDGLDDVVVQSRAHSPFQRFYQMNDHYIGYLCGLALTNAVAVSTLIFFVEKMDKHNSLTCTYAEIAERIGISPSQVYVAVNLLKKYGYITVVKRGGRGGGTTYAVNHILFWGNSYSAIKKSAFPPGVAISGPYVDVRFGDIPMTKQKIPSSLWRNQLLKQKEKLKQYEKDS